jgi:hypothetical protein
MCLSKPARNHFFDVNSEDLGTKTIVLGQFIGKARDFSL